MTLTEPTPDGDEAGQPAPSAAPARRERPQADPLAKKWGEKIAAARKHWDKHHRRVRYSRDVVAGLNWMADPTTKEFVRGRANLIQGTITGMLPQIYARNPEISAVPLHRAQDLKLLCHTLETVTNRHLTRADLKGRAKATVRSAITCALGAVKVMYQRDLHEDPVIRARINDTQDNLADIDRLLAEMNEPEGQADLEARQAELQQKLAALNEKTEVVAAEGLVIDRVLTDNLLVDPDVCEFADYKDADWIAQIVPMRREKAEGLYGVELDGATAYSQTIKGQPGGRLASAGMDDSKDPQIVVLEIWDRVAQRVYTLAEGCDFWLREPYSPDAVGERWYPFFLLPFQSVDGHFVGPSLLDLTERLQDEHNTARDRYNSHRDLCLPGWISGSDVDEKTIKRYADSSLGEITIIDTEGRPLQQVIVPRQHPPIDPAVYDTSQVRYDWEQVTGLQDAARSTVVQPKTATEAGIMQQALSGRVSEFRDQVEDWLQEIAQYSAQILMQQLSQAQVERIMGPHRMQTIQTPIGPAEVPAEKSYEWPELQRDQVFGMLEMQIRAGTTGQPDRAEQQESWGKVLPIIQQLVTAIMQTQGMGGDPGPYTALLRETLQRFDDRLELDQFIPKPPMMPPGMPLAGGAPMPA